jgi:hypothetical protein
VGSKIMADQTLTRAVRLSLFLLSAAILTFEINLTRLFSVAQFYHFAFMIVGVALLGSGASGTFLALFPRLRQANPQISLGRISMATGLSILVAYMITNWLPFDSFSLAVDRRQIWVLALHYLLMATPFFFNGMSVALLLVAYPHSAGETYAVNLTGSALGCMIGLAAPSMLDGEGTVVLSGGLASLAALLQTQVVFLKAPALKNLTRPFFGFSAAILVFSLLDLGLRLVSGSGFPGFELHLSPYKSISYALQYPGSEIVYQRWNSFSRVDLVRSPGIRSLPGLSYHYLQPPPLQNGLFVDGDNLSPVILSGGDSAYLAYLPNAIAYSLRPEAKTLILEPSGGLDVLTALNLGAAQVTAVEVNPLIVEAAAHIYAMPHVKVETESGRSYLQRTDQQFDVIVFSLASSYHPVGSGAYSLVEDYRYTVEAFQDALARLKPSGLLIITLWLQNPPSESLRAFALSIAALETNGGDPVEQIVAFRGYQTGTVLVKNKPFTSAELGTIRTSLAKRGFDLTYAPDVQPDETNVFNVLPVSIYYQTFTDLIKTQPREAFYAFYPYDIRPPTDEQPFFGHFFKWSQAPQVLAELGHTWQPFGGAGYFVILALLGLALVMAGVLIIAPVALKKNHAQNTSGGLGASLIYFGMIGLAFLLIEMPLIQRFILYLGHLTYSLAVVLFTLLIFSGVGSRLSGRFSLRVMLPLLFILLLGLPMILPQIFDLTLGLPLIVRLGLTILFLSPVGFLMGIPFPAGIRRLTEIEGQAPEIPWVWAVNGAASVISSVVAALLALTFGFNWVLRLGALCYVIAWLMVLGSPRPDRFRLPRL